MDAKVEITRVLKDLQASAREFAALGLAAGSKALERTNAHLRTLEENMKKTAERLNKKDDEPIVQTAAESDADKPADDKQ
jgi:hypothetical protein